MGAENITASQFQSELARRSQGFPDAFKTPEQRAALLEEMIRRKAALVKARAAGVDRDPQTQALVEQLIASRFIEAGLAKETTATSSIGDAEIKAHYLTNAATYRIPARVRAGVIWLKAGVKAEPARRAELRDRAMALCSQAAQLDAGGFARLVQQHSEDQSTRYIAGDTGWLDEGKASPHWPDEVVQAALVLNQPGAVAPLVETTTGFFIVRLSERHESGIRPLADVREAIRHELTRKEQLNREQVFLGELKRGLNIHINQQAFDALSPPPSTATATAPKLPDGL